MANVNTEETLTNTEVPTTENVIDTEEVVDTETETETETEHFPATAIRTYVNMQARTTAHPPTARKRKN